MNDIICHCVACSGEFAKSEMHERKSEIYPYKRSIYLCEQCNEKRERRFALKAAKSNFKKPDHFHR